MGRKNRKYENSFKREAVRFLEETGRPLREVAEELKVSAQALWRWRKQYGSGPAQALTPSEAEELRQLRRRVAVLEQERDFLKKAAAYFANGSPDGTP